MKKTSLRKLVLGLGLAMSIGLCGCDSGNTSRGLIDNEDDGENTSEVSPTPADISPDIIDPNFDVYTQDLDYTSEKALMEFVSGDWYLMDRKSGKDIGKLTIGADGSIEYTRTGFTSTCKGELGFTYDYGHHTEGMDAYEITMNEVPEDYTGGEVLYLSGSKGYFHIGQAAGQDYLYLEECGNGGSELVYYVLVNPAYTLFDRSWVFHRENEVTETCGCVSDSVFYAMLWGNTDDELLLQVMDEACFETASEYTDFKYMGAVFDEKDHPDAALYEKAADLDLSMILETYRYESAIPAGIYEVTTDSKGFVTQIADVETAGYGEYALYPLEQDVSYDGLTFTCNGRDFTLEQLGNVGNAITDVKQFGDYAIIQAHMNPHRCVYTFYNMRGACPTRTIGAGELLFGDDIWDFYTSDMNAVFDGNGDLIYEVDGTEIVGLSFTDDGKHIKVEYWKDDYITVYEDIIDRTECLNAPIYAYAEYRRHQTAGTWEQFVKYAPEGAVFMVMVNPPSDDVWDFYQPRVVGDGGSDIFYAIALYEDTEFGFGGGESDFVNKGGMVNYNVTVPEGGPVMTLYAVAPGKDGDIEAEWPVATISGKDDTRWTFAVEQ